MTKAVANACQASAVSALRQPATYRGAAVALLLLLTGTYTPGFAQTAAQSTAQPPAQAATGKALADKALADKTATAEFVTPRINFLRIDWRAALDQLAGEINARPEAAGFFNFASGRRLQRFTQRRAPALVQLNALTGPMFAGIGRSPVPVLLPFDVAGLLAERAVGAPDGLAQSRYQAGFAADFFHAGASGYDAVFSMAPAAPADLPGRVFTRPVEVHITGSLLTYDIADPIAGRGEAMKTLGTQFPDMRRFIREGFVRYAFSRFGAAYVVSINCLDSTPRNRRLACREAYPVAERLLKALRVAGGTPSPQRYAVASGPIPRPAVAATDFTYLPPGAIIPGTGYRGKGGLADFTVYAQMRFPLREAPAYANSQLYKPRRACAATSDASGPSVVAGCREIGFARNGEESVETNYAYPWRDNYCERRDFEVGMCPGGMGHQGQDLRPATCSVRNGGSGGCQPLLHDVVAARDGVILRSPKQQAAFVQVNERNEHIRFRYVHMNPDQLDADGVVNGRPVREGEVFGRVANYQDHPAGTTTHLHFDIQVFTRDGWLWVNPYVTLIAAYENLIGARGREVQPQAASENGDGPSSPEDAEPDDDP